jgi:excisionase family DNA binding protein
MKRASPAPVLNGTAPTMPRLFSIETVATHLDVSEKTIRRRIETGELRAHRVGRLLRVSELDLAAYIAKSRVK